MYTHIHILRGFKTYGDAFRLPYSFAFDSIRPFLVLFHSFFIFICSFPNTKRAYSVTVTRSCLLLIFTEMFCPRTTRYS